MSTTYGWGVFIGGDAKYDTISRCNIDLSAITGTSSANANGIVVSGSVTSATTSSAVSNLYILNNKVVAGSPTVAGGSYYGIAFTGTSGTVYNDSIFIIGNEVTNFYYYGIRYYYAQNGEVSNNNIHRSAKTVVSTSAYGIYAYFCAGIKMNGNKIHDFSAPGVTYNGTFYGMYNFHTNNTAATPIVISNNIIYNTGTFLGTQYLAYNYGPYLDFYHNTIDASTAVGTGIIYGCYFQSDFGSRQKNNTISIGGTNTGAKYGMYVANAVAAPQMQKNNVYINTPAAGIQNPYFYGSGYTTLAAFQAAYPMLEISSPSVDPLFVSASTGNLTPTASALINNGSNVLASVSKDFNGLSRSVIPTIGAFEVLPSTANDGKAVTFITPAGSYCANTTTPVKVVIGNAGTNSITSMTVNWKVNGVAQTPFSYTNTLVSPSSATGTCVDTITLGSITLATGATNVVVWVSNPNATTDPNHNNDTIFWSGNSALPGGTYTINSGAPATASNFQSFNTFKDALSNGICGSVVANVVVGSGPYNEQVEFLYVSGTSAASTIKINGNGETIQFNNAATNAYPIVNVNGTQYLTINNLKIKSLNATYGWGLLVTGSAMRDSIINCEIDLSSITGTSSVSANGLVVSGSQISATSSSIVSYLTIKNNTIIAGSPTVAGGAYYGLAYSGSGSTTLNDSINIIGNTVTNFYYYGIRALYVNGGDISNNDISRPAKTAVNSTTYGMYIYYCTGIKVVGNRVHDLAALGVTNSGSLYGIYNNHPTNTATTPILIANNAVYNLGTYYGTQYLTYAFGPYVDFFHNTVDASIITATGTGTTYGCYVGSNVGSRQWNNIINITGGNTGTKYGFYFSTAANAPDLKKNNVNLASTQTGTQNPYYFSSAYTSLAAFQAANPTQEVGSPNVDPMFVSAATGNLLPANALVIGAGTNALSSVPKDILGTTRAAAPTIGAFEVSVPILNNGALLSVAPVGSALCAGNQTLKVIVSNAGTNNITPTVLNWTLNGVAQAPVTSTATLVPAASAGQHNDTLTVSNVLVNTSATIKFWITTVNGVLDTDHSNDTMTTTVTVNAFPVVNLGNDTAICAGQTLTLNAGTANATYTKLWSNAATTQTIPVTTAGTYSVMVSNNGCAKSDTIVVSVLASPTVNLGNDTSICAGQTLTLNAGAANSTYTKLWSNLATTQTIPVTTAGTYSVKVTNGTCSKSDTIVVSVNALPVVNLGADTAICAGSTLTLSAGAANSTYTKLWSNAATTQTIPVTTAGTYSVMVSNGACAKSDTIVVSVNALPVVNLGADTAICAGTSLTLDAGNAGATYLWTGGTTAQTLAVTTAGTYGVTVTKTGCMATDSIVIGVTALPSVTGITATGAAPTFAFTANGATNVTTYAWNFGDAGTAAIAAPTHTYVQTEVDQTFTVTLIVSNECGSDTVTTTVNVPKLTGINSLQLNAKELKLYPNPAQQLITVENDSKLTMKQIRITNILGQEVVRIAVTNQAKQTINVANLAAGLYHVTIEFEEGTVNRKLEILK